MVFNGKYGADTMSAPSAILVGVVGSEFLPVCGAMCRNHLIKE